MALNLLKHVAPQWRTPEWHEGEDEAPEFKLRPLTSAEKEEVMAVDESGNIHIPFSKYDRIIRRGCTDWNQYVTDPETGKPAKFSMARLAMLPTEYRVWMAGEILSMSELQEDDRKNS